MKKEKAIAVMQNMPDDFSLDGLIERLILLEKLEEAEQSIREGKVYTGEQVKAHIEQWKTESRSKHARPNAA